MNKPVQTPNRDHPSIPVYIQIAENLLDQIESGVLSPGDRLPPERELSEKLGVNRLTLRRALQKLEIQGLLNRRQGAGTYVSEPKIEQPAEFIISFTKGMQRRGYIPGAKIVKFENQPVEKSSADDLGLSTSDRVYHIFRLRLINQEPVLLERLTIPAHRFPGFDRHDLATRSLYEVMETEYGITALRARQSLEPVIALNYEAELLDVLLGAPLMLQRRLSFDQDDLPIEYGKDLYRGDRFRFVTEIAPLEI
ncbi:MAG: GntR family transcriptional regulator [Anaerolineales bacterium]|uniref:GntR family transcriptional regulator n=1 Tax=Candidatus Desulfolinea nitratireducens TaxID=2841698 RepID=A0A8J6NG89_9CHLR|nr:GntR family transcriptional regulator [Candidatus Desulfolinea nitratireducens]MBL6961783.1 GntR family transcriptional regulator [Anaerolineales bacterium]